MLKEQSCYNESEIKQQKGTKLKNAIEIIIALLLGITISQLITTYVGSVVIVSGESMEDTLHDGDYLWLTKIDENIERFDVVVIDDTRVEAEHIIKRVIALPGETVQIIKGKVYVNNEKLDEHYCKAPIRDSGIAESEIILGDNEYFVLGDNRNNSTDSRYNVVGLIKREQIRGKVYGINSSYGYDLK